MIPGRVEISGNWASWGMMLGWPNRGWIQPADSIHPVSLINRSSYVAWVTAPVFSLAPWPDLHDHGPWSRARHGGLALPLEGRGNPGVGPGVGTPAGRSPKAPVRCRAPKRGGP